MGTATAPVTTVNNFKFRSQALSFLQSYLGCDPATAESWLGKLIKASKLSNAIDSTDEMKSVIQVTIMKPTSSIPSRPPNDLDTYFDDNQDIPESPADLPPVVPDTPVIPETKAETPVKVDKPEASRLPMNGGTCARVWRRFEGEDIEFLVAGQDVEQMLNELALLFAMSQPAQWLEKKKAQEAANPAILKEGDLYTYTGHLVITSIVAHTQRFNNKSTTYLQFWADNRQSPEFAPVFDTVFEQVSEQLGVDIDTRTELVGKWELTVKLGRLGRYSKDVPEKGKHKDDPKDPRYPASYWQDFVSIKPVEQAY